MAKFSINLHPRPKKDGTCALMFSFTHKHFRKQIHLGLDLLPEQWNSEVSRVVKHPQYRVLNQRIQVFSTLANDVLLRYLGSKAEGEVIFGEIEAALFPEKVTQREEEIKVANTLEQVSKRFAELKKPSTRLTYERTIKHIEIFIKKGNSNVLDEINKTWLTAFDNYLAETNPSPNARALHLRNLRAIFNYALDEELTANYPFRRFKIKTVKTDKRSLSVEKLREILNYPIEDWQVIYRDMFKLSFMLMGINFVDMLNLEKSDVREGRIVFNRHKTARLYSMKVEPEALELIEKYGGEKYLLSVMDNRTDYLQFIRQTNNALCKIGDCERKGLGGKKKHKAICPDLSTYWARHTWATIAGKLDIPKETIAASLGHGGNTVTDIYIDFDRDKIDDANRKVLDWVLYGIDYRVEKKNKKRSKPKKVATPEVKKVKNKKAA